MSTEETMTQTFQISSGQWFAYDPLTNHILTLRSDLHKEMEHGTTIEEILTTLLDEEIIQSGEFQNTQWLKTYPECHKEKIKSLVLQITRQCNLACDYCVYSGNYTHMLPHADSYMSPQTIFRCIDFFAEHSAQAEELSIAFYGGEALLHFDLVKLGTAYARERMGDRILRFSISSNGTTLTTPVLRWLAENPDVSVTITLNGPYHDQHRKTVNGEGSLHTIMDHLQHIRRKYPDIWEKQVRFIANKTSDLEIPQLRTFYQEQIGRNPDAVTSIRPDMANDKIAQICSSDQSTVLAMTRHLREEYLQTNDPFLKTCFDPGLGMIHDRAILEDDRTAYVPSCLPMSGRLFVRCDGTFNICERVSDKLSIGNLEQEFDWKQIYRLYEQFLTFVDRQCRSCWAQRLCTFCYQDIIGADGEMISNMPNSFCERSKADVLEKLKMYCELVIRFPERLFGLE